MYIAEHVYDTATPPYQTFQMYGIHKAQYYFLRESHRDVKHWCTARLKIWTYRLMMCRTSSERAERSSLARGEVHTSPRSDFHDSKSAVEEYRTLCHRSLCKLSDDRRNSVSHHMRLSDVRHAASTALFACDYCSTLDDVHALLIHPPEAEYSAPHILQVVGNCGPHFQQIETGERG